MYIIYILYKYAIYKMLVYKLLYLLLMLFYFIEMSKYENLFLNVSENYIRLSLNEHCLPRRVIPRK